MPTVLQALQIAREYLLAGNPGQAEQIFSQIVQAEPNNSQAWHLRGLAAHSSGDLNLAAAYLAQAIDLNPQDASAHYNLGRVHQDRNDLRQALESYQRALQIKPDYVAAYQNTGLAFLALGNFDVAAACLQHVLSVQPEDPAAHYNLGNLLKAVDKPDEAEACYRQALQLKPDYIEALNNLAGALQNQGRLDQAAECFRQVLQRVPDSAEANWNLSLIQLLRGDFEHAWEGYLRRSAVKRQDVFVRNLPQPVWNGEDLPEQTLLLHEEQGLGDTLQFIRYAAVVKQRVRTVVVECDEGLCQLVASCPGVDRVIAKGQELPTLDVHAPIASLPAIFHSTLETIPRVIPYFFPDAQRVAAWREVLHDPGKFKVGIVWQGRQLPNRLRSIPLRSFAPLGRIPRVSLYSLQKESGSEELAAVGDELHVIDLAEKLTDFAETAAAMANLDLVISCDSAPAHLAGAIGVPVWVAIPFAPDWRWMLSRDDSPWYPSMRLFRQRQRGEWDEVLARIAEALQQAVARHRDP